MTRPFTKRVVYHPLDSDRKSTRGGRRLPVPGGDQVRRTRRVRRRPLSRLDDNKTFEAPRPPLGTRGRDTGPTTEPQVQRGGEITTDRPLQGTP